VAPAAGVSAALLQAAIVALSRAKARSHGPLNVVLRDKHSFA
jgi:hypothetical protein